jgi:penicillin-binding protein 1A
MQLALDIGPDNVKQAARDMGIRSELHGYPAETLGGLTNGVSPLEMANAYATIASGGYRNRPTAITKVIFPDGREELPDRWKVKRVQAFPDGVAAKARELLEQNMTDGTGTKAQIGCPAGGKTGTTDEFTDAWFVGFTPRLTTAVWVGYPKERVRMETLYYGTPVAGGTFPAEIWGAYMKEAKGKFCGDFKPPTVPFTSTPFFGEYASTGKVSEDDKSDSGGLLTPDPGADTGKPKDEKPNQGTGGDFDPDAYESPPQPDPAPGDNGNGNGNGNGGGTEAPGTVVTPQG